MSEVVIGVKTQYYFLEKENRWGRFEFKPCGTALIRLLAQLLRGGWAWEDCTGRSWGGN